MIIDKYLTQTAILKRAGGVDQYGEYAYASPVTVSVRWVYENKIIVDSDGREVISSAKLSTKAEVAPGDEIVDSEGRDREVITVRKDYDIDGVFSHYVAFLTGSRRS